MNNVINYIIKDDNLIYLTMEIDNDILYSISNNWNLLFRSEMMSNKRINEGDNDSSSDEDNDDNNTTQQREDAVQQNSIDGTIEESQAWVFKCFS